MKIAFDVGNTSQCHSSRFKRMVSRCPFALCNWTTMIHISSAYVTFFPLYKQLRTFKMPVYLGLVVSLKSSLQLLEYSCHTFPLLQKFLKLSTSLACMYLSEVLRHNSNSIFGAFRNHDQLGSVDSSYLMHANHVLCMETVEIGSLSSPHKKKLIIALAKEASKFETQF